MPEGLVTIRDVEILRVGNWHSGLSGRVPVTDDDISAMIAAAGDTEIDQAPLKIGHVDPRFDGEPALGWLNNLRNVAGTLVCDIEGAPSKMEALIRSAFKRRSAEIAWGVKTPSGKTYRAALAGLALLGVTPPAVKGLADVVSRYSAPESTSVDRVTVIDGDDSELAELDAAVLNTTAARDARKAFLSGNSGDLPNNRPDNRRDASTRTPLEGDVTDEQVRDALGLAPEVPVTDQFRKIATDAKTAADAKVAADAATAAQAKADQDAAAKAESDRLAAEAAKGNAPTLTVDKGAFEKLQADAARGLQAAQVLDDQEREKVLTSALSAGKIAPASVEAYRKLYDGNREGTKALLEGLPQVFSTVTHFSGAHDATGKSDDLELGIPKSEWDKFENDLKSMPGGK
jgi:hypothetical protein